MSKKENKTARPIRSYLAHDVLGDGNCYFRSLFHLLKNYGFLSVLHARYNAITVVDEDAFVKSFRRFIRRNLDADQEQYIDEVYSYLKSIEKEIFRAVVDASPEWFQCAFTWRRFSKMELGDFKTKLLKGAGRWGNWVGQMEHNLVAIALRNRFQINLEVINSLTPRFRPKPETLYLLNRGEIHYNYVLKDCPPGTLVNLKTERCIKAAGATARSLGLS